MAEMEQRTSRVIAKIRTQTKGKDGTVTDRAIDIQDNFTASPPGQYAQLHGTNWTDYGLRIAVTNAVRDASTGKAAKGASRYAKASVSPDVLAQVLEVCRKNIGTPKDPALDMLPALWKAHQELLRGVMLACADAVKGTSPLVPALGAALKQELKRMSTEGDPVPGTSCLSACTDFDLSQTHVNPYGRDSAGRAPVSVLHIWRTGIRKDGAAATRPWAVNIRNFTARIPDTGLTTYDESTKQDETEVYIQLTDSEMFSLAYRVEHFVTCYELMVAGPYVRAAAMDRAKAIAEKRANRTNGAA